MKQDQQVRIFDLVQSNYLNFIRQLGLCAVKLYYKDKSAKCRFPVDGPALLGMPDKELLGIWKTMCDMIEGQQVDREFNSEAREPYNALSCKVNTDRESRSDNL